MKMEIRVFFLLKKKHFCVGNFSYVHFWKFAFVVEYNLDSMSCGLRRFELPLIIGRFSKKDLCLIFKIRFLQIETLHLGDGLSTYPGTADSTALHR